MALRCRIIHTILIVFLALPSIASSEEMSKEVRDLIWSQGCRGCHLIAGRGGTVGPPLDKGKQGDRSRYLQALLYGVRHQDRPSMPSYIHLGQKRLEMILDVLTRPSQPTVPVEK